MAEFRGLKNVNHRKFIFLTVVLLFSLSFLFLVLFPPTFKENSESVYEEVGRLSGAMAAIEFAKLAVDKRVVLIGFTDEEFASRISKARMEGFKDQAKLEGLEIIKTYSPYLYSGIFEGEISEESLVEKIMANGMDARVIEDILKYHPEIKVIVSLYSIPSTGLRQINQLKTEIQLFALDETVLVDWRPFLQEGYIEAFLAYRKRSSIGKLPSDYYEMVRLSYILVTKENFYDVDVQIDYQFRN